MTYSITPLAGAGVGNAADTGAFFAVGGTVFTNDGGQSMYVSNPVANTTAIAAGDVLLISPRGAAVQLTTALAAAATATAGNVIGVAQVAMPAGTWAWAALRGSPIAGIHVSAATAVGAPLYTTATAGAVSATAAGSNLIIGMMLTTAAGAAGAAAGNLSHPTLARGTVGA